MYLCVMYKLYNCKKYIGRIDYMFYFIFKLGLVIYFSILGSDGCGYCGGLGHRITACPKLENVQAKKAGDIGKKDYLAESAADY